MNKSLFTSILIIIICIGIFSYVLYTHNKKEITMVNPQTTQSNIIVTPIEHATMVLNWDGKVIYTDPVGGANAFTGQPEPDLILITDIHSDHLNGETIQAVSKENTILVAPKAVADMLPKTLQGTIVILNNGEMTNQQGFSIEAIPMYNLPESATSYHVKGRGNGYVVEEGGKRIYISGDTADTPEMRNLKDIDMAFVSMNLPYTMSVESAASGVLAFKPKQIYPYHYRGQDGLSDINKFKELVNQGDPNIEVILLNWYPKN